MITYKIGQKIRDADSIAVFLKQNEESFNPKLSELVSINEYAVKIYNNSTLIISQEGDLTVGLLSFYENDFIHNTAYITYLLVLKSYQGKGIGKSMIEMMKKYVKERGFNFIDLEVLSDNILAINFYKNLGFKDYSQKLKSIILRYQI